MSGYLNMSKLIKNEKCKNQSLSHTNHISRSQELNVASAYILENADTQYFHCHGKFD